MISEEYKQQLIKSAKEALANRYPKDLDFAYSAAVLTTEGNIYSYQSAWRN